MQSQSVSNDGQTKSVREGSPIVTSSVDDNGDIEAGVYEVREG